MTEKELTEREEMLERAFENAITSMMNRMNEMAVRIAVSTSQDNSKSELMELLLKELEGNFCTIIMKNGSRYTGLKLKSFDKNTLLCSGNFNVGTYEPLYREMCIVRSEVAVIMENINSDTIADNVRRYRERYDATA